MTPDPWWVYVVRCFDNSLYCGITNNLSRRTHEHNNTKKGAKYTRSRRPVILVAAWECSTGASARRIEYQFKSMAKKYKEARVAACDLEALGLEK